MSSINLLVHTIRTRHTLDSKSQAAFEFQPITQHSAVRNYIFSCDKCSQIGSLLIIFDNCLNSHMHQEGRTMGYAVCR